MARELFPKCFEHAGNPNLKPRDGVCKAASPNKKKLLDVRKAVPSNERLMVVCAERLEIYTKKNDDMTM